MLVFLIISVAVIILTAAHDLNINLKIMKIMINLKKLPKGVKYQYRDIFGYDVYKNERFVYRVSGSIIVREHL